MMNIMLMTSFRQYYIIIVKFLIPHPLLIPVPVLALLNNMKKLKLFLPNQFNLFLLMIKLHEMKNNLLLLELLNKNLVVRLNLIVNLLKKEQEKILLLHLHLNHKQKF